jgi:Transposase DDE domain
MRPAPAAPCLPNWPGGALANDKNPQATGANPAKPGQGREALGRSRGGLTTKIHLAADRRCRPLTRILTPGQHGDCPQFIPLMNQLAIRRRGKGRPRTRPGAALGDKAHSSAANRAYLRKRRITAVIPVKEDQKNNRRARGRRGGRPPAFDQACYRDRNTVETSKPQCCHSRGWPASLLAPSCSVFMSAAWFFSQGRRLCWPRGTWCRARSRSISAGPARTTVSLAWGCR